MKEFKIGDRVKHLVYGEGAVYAIHEKGGIGVCFDHANEKLHSLEGACADLHGYWAAPDYLTMITPAKYAQLKVEVTPAPTDNTNPDHYKRGGTEAIDYLRAKMTDEEFKGFCRGNALKYISRAPDKNQDEDYRKAIWYLRMLIGDDPRKTK